MSGQTIEIINTDAEGRLVLADALWYTQHKYKPAFMVDLATLTGAMMVSLGEEPCGYFANDDKLADALKAAGDAVGEAVDRTSTRLNSSHSCASRFPSYALKQK